jgi:hypothetical protein
MRRRRRILARTTRITLALVAATIAFLFMFGYSTVYPLVITPLVIGVLVVTMSRNRQEALAVGAAAGFFGAVSCLIVFRQAAYVNRLASIPPYMLRDLAGVSIADFVRPLLESNPVNTTFAGPNGYLLPLIGGVLVAGVVLALFEIAKWTHKARLVRSASTIFALGLVVLSFTVTTWTCTSVYRRMIATRPPAGKYASDMIVYMETYNRMLTGEDFYRANIGALMGDKRLGPTIVKGKTRSWGVVFPWREPGLFYLWKAIAPKGPPQLFAWAVALAAGALIVAYLAALPWVGKSALLLPILLYPGLLYQVAWFNMLHPDWWAAMFMLGSMALVMNKRFVAAGVAGLAAALCREVLAIWLVILIAVAFWRGLRSPKWRTTLVVLVVLLAIFAVAYLAHLQATQPYLDPAVVKLVQADRSKQILDLVRRPMTDKLLAPTSYLMTPYGAPELPAWIFLPLGAAGLWLALRRDRAVAVAASGYLVVWFLIYVTLGATATYWGQEVTLVMVLGTGLLGLELAKAPPWGEASTGPLRVTHQLSASPHSSADTI